MEVIVVRVPLITALDHVLPITVQLNVQAETDLVPAVTRAILDM